MTAQTPDRLIYRGECVALFSDPLDDYYDQHSPRPPFGTSHSGNQRGYVALWAIVEDHLYLMAVVGRLLRRPPVKSDDRPVADGAQRFIVERRRSRKSKNRPVEPVDVDRGPHEIPLGDLIPGASGPVLANWYSGELCIPQGRMIEYVHVGYASRYERYLFIEIDKGAVISTRVAHAAKLWPKDGAGETPPARGWRHWLRRWLGRSP
jgi:hypothetical protein